MLLGDVWHRQAYSELTVDDVCAEAAVSKGRFYGYFESKQDLFHELLRRESASLDAVIADLTAAPIGAAERLRRFARACLKDAEDGARMQLRADLAAAVGGDPAIEAALRESAARRRAALRTWIEEGVALERAANRARQCTCVDPARTGRRPRHPPPQRPDGVSMAQRATGARRLDLGHRSALTAFAPRRFTGKDTAAVGKCSRRHTPGQSPGLASGGDGAAVQHPNVVRGRRSSASAC